MSDYADKSVEELEKINQDLMRKKAAIRAEQLKVVAAMDAKATKEALERDIANVEKKHNVQIVRPAGIESAEGVNGQ